MSKEFDEYIADQPELNLISKEDINLMKIKTGKSHRKESDWDTIKKILMAHDVITADPVSGAGAVDSLENILLEDGALHVFTNMDDCEQHIRSLQKRFGDIGRCFQISSMAFEDVIQIAEENEVDVLIDRQDQTDSRCLAYVCSAKRLKVVTGMEIADAGRSVRNSLPGNERSVMSDH